MKKQQQQRRRFWHATLGLCIAIQQHHLPQKAVLSQIFSFGECKVVVSQILLVGVEPHDAGCLLQSAEGEANLASPSADWRRLTRSFWHLHCHPYAQCAQTE